MNEEIFICDMCGKAIDGCYASFGGCWYPGVSAKTYHLRCIPPLPVKTIEETLDQIVGSMLPVISAGWERKQDVDDFEIYELRVPKRVPTSSQVAKTIYTVPLHVGQNIEVPKWSYVTFYDPKDRERKTK